MIPFLISVIIPEKKISLYDIGKNNCFFFFSEEWEFGQYHYYYVTRLQFMISPINQLYVFPTKSNKTYLSKPKNYKTS